MIQMDEEKKMEERKRKEQEVDNGNGWASNCQGTSPETELHRTQTKPPGFGASRHGIGLVG